MSDVAPPSIPGNAGSLPTWVRSRRGIVRFVAVVGTIGLAAALILPAIRPASDSSTVFIFEELSGAVPVVGRDELALVLADGRKVVLPGVAQLPAKSEILDQATAKGVELTPEGRVIGLMPIHYRCSAGMTTLREARVDLAHLMIYFGQAEVHAEKLHAVGTRPTNPAGGFWQGRCRIESFKEFAAWSKRASEVGL